jgi:hypothetical protein
MELIQEQAIAKAKFLGYFLTARQPVNINVDQLSKSLNLTPEQITEILRELEVEGKLKVTILRAIAHQLNNEVPSPVMTAPTGDDSEWEDDMQSRLDAESAEKTESKKRGGRSQ